ncbi:MAG TPA: APC family permease [Streptosporangiaceae bacterium]|nr:APC family permease [Streptosporangiaceae bacterium]
MTAATGDERRPAAATSDPKRRPDAAARDDKHRLTALEGLAALSLDALSSVAYGPEAIVVVMVAAGTTGLSYTLPVTAAIVVLLVVLVISYRQVIAAFPAGGGAYAVAGRHLGTRPSLIAAASLIVDYVLNAAVGVSAGVEALTSAFPQLYADRVLICLIVLALITAANMWGVAESARLLILPTVIFIVAIAAVLIGGLVRTHPVVPVAHNLPQVTQAVGLLLLLRAFASGCSALTGVEAIANAVPSFRQPRVRRAQHTEMWLGILLGAMLLGVAVLIRKFHVTQSPTRTVLAELTAASLGHNFVFYAVQLITTVLLALAANTSFGGLPVLASLLARDNFLPHLFFLRADRQVHRYGVGVLAVAAAILLVASSGDTQALVPLFAIGVFVGFTLSQAGMVRHWHEQHGHGWARRAAINGVGAVLTTVVLAIELLSKFTRGAWLVVIVVPLLVLMFSRVHATYDRIGAQLGIGEQPPPPRKLSSLVVVPVGGMSRLTVEAISAALSLGDEVVAVTVCYADPEDTQVEAHFRDRWDAWHPNVPLITLRSEHRSLAPPIVDYLRKIENEDRYHRLVVLIAEVQPARPWQRILYNQRGFVLDRAIQRGTVNVVICRLHFKLSAVSRPPAPR